MQCDQCGRAIQPGDRFCTGCGVRLSGDATTDATKDDKTTGDATTDATTDDATTAAASDPPDPATDPATGPVPAADADPADDLPRTQLVEQVEGDGLGDDDPVWAVTGAVPVADTVGLLPRTEPIAPIGGDRGAPVGVVAEPWDAATTTATTTAVPATAQMPAVAPAPPPPRGFRFGAVALLGIAGGIVLLVGVFATVVEITANAEVAIGDDAPPAFRLGTWIADDLGGNLSIAGLIAALVMAVGGVAASFGWRWGSGLAGGGGLAAAGLAALVIGLAQYPIDAAYEFADIPTDQEFVLTITKGLGYWLLVAAGAIGIVVFFASTNDALRDRRGGLNPWIAALGALAVVVAAAGPLIPDDLGELSDNWYVIDRPGEPPAMLVAMRLVQLGLLALGGVIGFLSVRRWGLGVAAGATLPAIWLGVSTLFEVVGAPVGPGFRNPGATDTTLHGVTIIGLSATLGMLVLAVVAAWDQSTRR